MSEALAKEMARRLDAKVYAELDAEIEALQRAMDDDPERRKVTGLLPPPASLSEAELAEFKRSLDAERERNAQCEDCGHPRHAHRPACIYHDSPTDPFDPPELWRCECETFIPPASLPEEIQQ